MGRDVVYAEALADLESDITKRVRAGDDDGMTDEKLLKRWEMYRKGKDLAYVPSRTLEILHRDERMVRGVMGPVGCLAGESRIWTSRGLERIDDLYKRGEPFMVWSMGKDNCPSLELATAPFVKGCEPLYVVSVGDMGRFRCAGAHLVLTGNNHWSKVEDMSEYGSCFGFMGLRSEQSGAVDITLAPLNVHKRGLEAEPSQYYDLTVESTGNYIGEWGIIHHNSGKTTGVVADMNMRHFRQRICRDGIVRDRFALVRGTLALLNATLVDTWVRMFPRTKTYGSKYGVCGSLTQVRNGVTHIIYLRGFGLDKQGALGNLLSNNFSGAIINEAVTISEAAKDGTAGRNGRYPDLMDAPAGFENMPGAWIDKDGYPRWFLNHGVSMDTNAASEDSWWYKKSRDGGADPEREVYFEQPPAAFREWDDANEKWVYELNMGQRPGVPPAENIEHIPEHWDYYRNIIGSSGEAHIRRYVCSEYSKTEVGNAVFSDFSERWHVANSGVPWPPPGTRLVAGMDFGQDRCTVIGYHSAEGRLMVCAEASDKTGSVEEFGNNVLRPLLAQHGFTPNDITIFCDPAGLNKGEHSSIGGILGMRMCGFNAMPPKNLPNNDVLIRLESVRHFLTRIVGAKGAVQLDPGCTRLVRSIGGGYVWQQRRVGVEKMDTDTPAKNAHSHIADAFQYLCCGVRYGGDESKVLNMVVIGQNGNRVVYGSQSQRAGYLEESALC